MSEYRRSRVPGGTYFFTVALFDRRADLLITHIDALRSAVRSARLRRPFHIDAWIVLPDHMHCIWTLPEADQNFSERWRDIKVSFSKSLPNSEARSASRARRGERGIWQRRFWEHTIRDDADYAVHMDYVHFNSVKHGYASHPGEWPFSSFRHCVAEGLYPAEWAHSGSELVTTGERL